MASRVAEESAEFSELVNYIIGEEVNLNLQQFDLSTSDAQSDSPFSTLDEQTFAKLAQFLDLVRSVGVQANITIAIDDARIMSAGRSVTDPFIAFFFE